MSSNLLSLVRDLQRRKARRRRGLAVAEGVRLVEDALAAGVPFRGVVVDPSLRDTPRGTELLANLAAHAIPLEEVSARDLAALADTDSPQGIIAAVEFPTWRLDDVRPSAGVPVLVLDAVQDPGNVGTLLRTAFALGAAGAILLKGTADPKNPKVVRAAMGATFRFPVIQVEETAFRRWIEEHGIVVWVGASQGTPLEQLTPPARLAVVVGNEGAGIRPSVQALTAERVAIPLARGAESLNVAVAAGIVLYHARRRE